MAKAANAAGGVDISLPVTIATAAVLYLVLLFAVPEPRYVFDPAGPLLVPASDGDPYDGHAPGPQTGPVPGDDSGSGSEAPMAELKDDGASLAASGD